MNEEVTDVPIGIERVDPIKIMMLKNYDLDVTDDGRIYIKKTRFDEVDLKKMHPIISFPQFVYGIRSGAFSNVKNANRIIIGSTELTDIEQGALTGCDVKHLVFGNAVNEIILYKDTCTSENLQTLELSNSIKCIKSNAFIKCIKLKRVVIPTNCIVEEDAFPSNCLVVRYNVDKDNIEEVDAITNAPKKKYYFKKTKKIKSRYKSKGKTIKVSSGKITNAFCSFFSTLLKCFKVLLNSLFKVVTFIPYIFYKFFRLLFKKIFKSIRHIRFDFRKCLDILPYILMIAYIILAYTCTIQLFGVSTNYVSWLTNWIEGYGLSISSFAVSLFSKSSFLLYIPILLFLIIGFVFDIIAYILMVLALIIIFVLIVVLCIVITFIIPVLIPVYYLIMLIKRNNKLYDALLLLVSIAVCILYFVLYFKIGIERLM